MSPLAVSVLLYASRGRFCLEAAASPDGCVDDVVAAGLWFTLARERAARLIASGC